MRHLTTKNENCREGHEAQQRELAAAEAKRIGGKFRSRRGTDAFGHPVLIVVDADGRAVAEVTQGL